jgi:hypothetical protein
MSKAISTEKYLDRDATVDMITMLIVADGRDAVYLSAETKIDKPTPMSAEIALTLYPAATVRLIENLAAIATGNGWIFGHEIHRR